MSASTNTPTDTPPSLTAMFSGEPDAVVLHAPGGRSRTRGALLADVRTVNALCAASLEPGQRAAFVVRDGLVAVPTFLGMATHCGCVPLDANLPAARLAESLEALGVDVVLALAGETTEAVAATAACGLPLWTLEREADGPLRCTSPTPVERTSPTHGDPASHRPRAALVLQTSGSTGPPKGVSQPLGHLVTGAGNVANALELDARDRCLNPMPLFHIHGLVAGVLAPLSCGGSVLVCHGASEAETVEAWRDFCPTWSTAVPTRHRATLTALKDAVPPVDVSAVRLLRTASAPMQTDLQHALEAFFDAPVVEAYGMTEATHQIAANPIDRKARRIGSVGLPRGFEVEVRGIDAEPGSLPTDEEGAVWIRGDTLMSGYDDRHGTAAGITAGGWFDTGDLGRLDVEGYLYLTGRRSETINRGGEKVQPLAVDRVLQSHPAIDAAVTFAHPHPTLHQDVAAAVLLRPGTKRPSEAELRQLCFAELPPYQVPTRVLVLEELPSTSTGKLSRRLVAEALAPLLAAPSGEASDDTPSDELERMVATRFAAELAVPGPVGRDDNFFMLGGDSLSGVRVVASLAHDLAIPLAPDALFKHPTPTTLAVAIRTTGNSDTAGTNVTGPSTVTGPPASDRLPLPDGMVDYWLQERLGPPSLSRHRITRLPLAAAVSDAQLRKALDTLVVMHPVFRLRVRPLGRRVTGLSGVPYRVPLLDVDPSGVEAFTATPFDLDDGPLLRAGRVRNDAGHDVLVLCAHHLTMDARSEQIVADWFATCFASPTVRTATADDATEAERTFFCALHDVVPSDAEREQAVHAAITAVRGAPLPIPATVPRPRVLEQARDALDLYRAPETTPAAAVIGLWHRARIDAGASSDTVYRLVTSVRTADRSADVCGFFVNVLPLRLDFPPGADRHDAVRLATRALADVRSRPAGTVAAIARSKGTRDVAAALRAAPLLNIDTNAAGRQTMSGIARSTLDDTAPEGSLEYRALGDGKACLRLWGSRGQENVT